MGKRKEEGWRDEEEGEGKPGRVRRRREGGWREAQEEGQVGEEKGERKAGAMKRSMEEGERPGEEEGGRLEGPEEGREAGAVGRREGGGERWWRDEEEEGGRLEGLERQGRAAVPAPGLLLLVLVPGRPGLLGAGGPGCLSPNPWGSCPGPRALPGPVAWGVLWGWHLLVTCWGWWHQAGRSSEPLHPMSPSPGHSQAGGTRWRPLCTGWGGTGVSTESPRSGRAGADPLQSRTPPSR